MTNNELRRAFPALCLSTLLLLGVGCGSTSSKRVASDLAPGDHVTLRLSSARGELEVSGVDVEEDEAEEDDGDVVEAADVSESDDGVEAESEDGELNDSVECEQEGDEDENQGCAPMATVVGPVHLMPADGADVLWLKVQLPGGTEAVQGQVLRFRGSYRGSDSFSATTVSTTTTSTPRVMGVLQEVVKLGGGELGLRIFDRTLRVDPRLKLRRFGALSSTVEQDVDGATEEDGIVCEQQGEHQGENEGC